MLTYIILYNLFENQQRVANFMQNTKLLLLSLKLNKHHRKRFITGTHKCKVDVELQDRLHYKLLRYQPHCVKNVRIRVFSGPYFSCI